MASGFIILQDGRCFAKRWWCYDAVLREVITELNRSRQEQELAIWLRSLLPGPDDVEELGYGAWLRNSDGEIISRHLDIRELTEGNHNRFNQSVLRALSRLKETEPNNLTEHTITCLSLIAEMIECAERGEPPLSLSDWDCVEPPSGKRLGPGWDVADSL